MRILIIEGRETIGGGQVITKTICEALNACHDIGVWIPGNNKSPMAKFLEGFKLFYYPHKQYKSGRKGIKDYLKFLYNLLMPIHSLWRTNQSFKPDIFYIQHLSMLPIVLLLNLFLKKKIIAHIHVIYVDKRAKWLLNYLLKHASIVQIVGVSNYSLSQLSISNLRKSCVVYNPVKLLPSLSDVNTELLNIAIIGDVYPGKGHHVLLRAFKGKPDKYRIHIIGNIVDSEYKHFLDTEYSDENTIYTGMIDNVSEYLANNKVVIVVVSVVGFETFSLAMVESWAQGIPTVATNDFGMKELVETFLPQYSQFLLFPLGNSEVLYEKIKKLISDRIKYKQISEDVRKTVETNFSIDNFSKQINQIIRKYSYQ